MMLTELTSKLELSPELQETMLEANNFPELVFGVSVLKVGIPVLWLLSLLILWRISNENCINRVSRGYRIVTFLLIGVSCSMYAISWMLPNLMQILSALVVSSLIILGSNYSGLSRYREEYLG